MISIIVPTYRIGGFDVMVDSLERQTYRDFELIIADELYEHRHPIIKSRLETCSFPVQHLKPDGGPRLSNYSRSINNAVVHARGDVILMQADYTFFPPNCLERHAEVQELSDGRSCIMLDVHNTALPPLDDFFYKPCDPEKNRGITGYGVSFGPNWENVPYPTPEDRAVMEALMNEAAEHYENALKDGTFDRFMWSIFRTGAMTLSELSLYFSRSSKWNLFQGSGSVSVECEGLDHTAPKPSALFRNGNWPASFELEILRSHVKSNVPQVDPNWCSLKNESIPTEAFLAVNGLDEDFDGCHLYQDQEFAWRVHSAGYAWTKNEGGEVYIVNPRSILYSKRLARPMTDRGAHDGTSNQELMHRKQQTGEAVNPHRNLRVEREVRLEQAL